MKPREKQELYLRKAHGEFVAYRIYRSASGVGSLDDLLGTILHILELQMAITSESAGVRKETPVARGKRNYADLKKEEWILSSKLEIVQGKIKEIEYGMAGISNLMPR